MGWWGKYIGYKPSMRMIREIIEADTGLTVKSVKFGYAICVYDEQAMAKAEKKQPDLLNYIMIALWKISEGHLMIKQVGEDMGPVERDIPMKYINAPCKAVENSKFATEWRQNVREYHKRRKEKLALVRSFCSGDIIYCYNEAYKFSYIKNSSWIIATQVKNGRSYRLRHWQVSNIAKDLPDGVTLSDG